MVYFLSFFLAWRSMAALYCCSPLHGCQSFVCVISYVYKHTKHRANLFFMTFINFTTLLLRLEYVTYVTDVRCIGVFQSIASLFIRSGHVQFADHPGDCFFGNHIRWLILFLGLEFFFLFFIVGSYKMGLDVYIFDLCRIKGSILTRCNQNALKHLQQ